MTAFRVWIELGELIPPSSPLGPDMFPNLAYAVRHVAENAQQRWMAYAGGTPLPDGSIIQSRSGAYLRSIQLVQHGAFNAEIFSDLPYAESIETGTPARDLKRMLDTSMKVRTTKDGRRYLIIPFRWGTPGATGFGNNVMPHAVHDIFIRKEIAPSRVVGVGRRLSGTGAYDINTRAPVTVSQRKYKWGGRLTVDALHAAGVHGKQAKRMTGMVNMRNPAGNTGGGKHSQFLTFRVMVEGSSGWLVPAKPGRYPARTTADRVRPIAEKAFGEAVRADINQAFGGGS